MTTNNNIREPYVSGTFYSSEPDKLYEEINSFFKTDLDKKKATGNFIAGISPHAGYFFSGLAASYLYANLNKDTKRIIILGFSHSRLDKDLSTTTKHWDTPIGIVKSDEELIKKIVENKIAVENDYSLENEHSIELQIPIIKYLIDKEKLDKNVKIIPLSIPNLDYKNKAKEIIELLKNENKLNGTIFIASSDFIHYGEHFGYTPFDKDVEHGITTLDSEAIQLIINQENEEFTSFIKDTKATICGIHPIMMLIEITKILNLEKGKLLNYYKSSDIIEDRKTSVSYASIGFFN